MSNDPKQDGRLELAIQAIKSDRVTSVRRAAQLYDVPRSTLQDRLNGNKQRVLANLTKRKLTKTKELTRLHWILSMDKRGAPFRPTTVRDMANILLANRDTLKPPLTVVLEPRKRFRIRLQYT